MEKKYKIFLWADLFKELWLCATWHRKEGAAWGKGERRRSQQTEEQKPSCISHSCVRVCPDIGPAMTLGSTEKQQQ